MTDLDREMPREFTGRAYFIMAVLVLLVVLGGVIALGMLILQA